MIYVSYLNRSFPTPLSLSLNAAIIFSVILNLQFHISGLSIETSIHRI